jgi:4-amino-4-deoxy-L-arabinose transferase-like glycosyltransferase
MVLRHIIFVVILGLAASGIFVCFFPSPTSSPDAAQYDRIAYNLASGNGYSLSEQAPFVRTMFREPAYPVFLAIIYRIAGHVPTAALIVQMALHAATAVLAYLIAKDAFGERCAFFSAIAVSVFPTLANTAAYLLSETFFTFILCLGLWLYIVAMKSGRLALFILSGAIFGLSALTKAALIFLPAVLISAAILLMLAKRSVIKARPLNLIVFFAAFCILVSIWMVRNVELFNTPSLALRGGEALWSRAQKIDDPSRVVAATACFSISEFLGKSLFPDVTARPERFLFKDFDKAVERRARYVAEGFTDQQIDGIFIKEASGKILKDPLKYVLYTPVEAIKMTAFTYLPFLNEKAVAGRFDSLSNGRFLLAAARGASRLAAYPILALFFVSIVRHLRDWDSWMFLFAITLYFNLMYSLLDAIGRYAVPLIPIYCIMAVSAFFPADNRTGA